MEDYKLSIPIDWSYTWTDGDSDGDYFLTCGISANLAITINQDVTNAHCVITGYSEHFDPGSLRGVGFTNIGGIAWAVPPFHRTTSMPTAAVDTFSRAWDELYTACPALRQRAIIAVAVDDRDCSHQSQQGTNWNQMDFPLNGNIGEMQNLQIVSSYKRWHNWSDPDNENWTAVTESDTYYSIQFAPEGDVDFPYFPFAVYKTNVWKSCNRAGGSLCRYEGGSWVEKKNWLLTDDKTTSQGMVSGSWTKLPIIGDE